MTRREEIESARLRVAHKRSAAPPIPQLHFTPVPTQSATAPGRFHETVRQELLQRLPPRPHATGPTCVVGRFGAGVFNSAKTSRPAADCKALVTTTVAVEPSWARA